jgi:hypothetical protein
MVHWSFGGDDDDDDDESDEDDDDENEDEDEAMDENEDADRADDDEEDDNEEDVESKVDEEDEREDGGAARRFADLHTLLVTLPRMPEIAAFTANVCVGVVWMDGCECLIVNCSECGYKDEMKDGK